VCFCVAEVINWADHKQASWTTRLYHRLSKTRWWWSVTASYQLLVFSAHFNNHFSFLDVFKTIHTQSYFHLLFFDNNQLYFYLSVFDVFDHLLRWPSGQSTRAPCAVERHALRSRGSNLSPDTFAYQRIISNNSYEHDEQGDNPGHKRGFDIRQYPL